MNNYSTVLVGNDNALIVTTYSNIMQHSKNVHLIKIFVPQQYGTFDMSMFAAQLEIIPPNQKYEIIALEPELEGEKENYIQYNLEIPANYTMFAGDISMALIFTSVDTDNGKSYIRHTQSCTIPILPIERWNELITDDALTALDQKLIKMEQQVQTISNLADAFNATKADDIGINEDGDVQLKANDHYIGNPISVAIPGIEDEDIDSKQDGILDFDEYYENLETVNI